MVGPSSQPQDGECAPPTKEFLASVMDEAVGSELLGVIREVKAELKGVLAELRMAAGQQDTELLTQARDFFDKFCLRLRSPEEAIRNNAEELRRYRESELARLHTEVPELQAELARAKDSAADCAAAAKVLDQRLSEQARQHQRLSKEQDNAPRACFSQVSQTDPGQ
ncbi:hypothetical protein CYMTET_10109 [Cymbomonas tetramitiformis]|uniref:Uncharacterized protein n=1 Tax=Cymbomonas tetramitiformis TaxID=36881 RepID=A0AAE0GQ87_9CHLO|nr:hypothetical protein CYMTET_10109 [Cymbomonas tetramitiformis]